MKQTFSINFICRQSKVSKKTGLAPIELSIVINGQRTYLALQRKMKPEEFKKLYESKRDNSLKHYISIIRQKIDALVDDMMLQNIPLTTAYLKEYFQRGAVREGYTLNQMFNDILDLKVKQNMVMSSYRRYERARDYFFKMTRYSGEEQARMVDVNDIATMKAMMLQKYGVNYTATIMSKIKSAFVYAFERGKINSIPFAGIKFERKRETDTVRYLTAEQLNAIRELDIDSPHIDNVRKRFLFQCGCGLSVSDMMKLTADDFEFDGKGTIYIKKKRQKTGVEYVSVLINDAPDILQEWDFTIPKLSPQKYNDYLKVIGAMVGIANLTTHMARHTYATQLMNSGIPIEIIQKALGHSSPYMTRIYAKLMDNTVITEISKMKNGKNKPSYTILR